MVTRTWKIHGWNERRQAVSFGKSYVWNFSKNNKIRIIRVYNSDYTGTNDYSIIKITRDTAEECARELEGQLSDGIFENYRYGKVEEI